MRFGLQSKFLAGMGLVLVGVLALMAVMWQRQAAMQAQVFDVGRQTMRDLVGERLKRRGESTVVQLADALTNPMYYSDLDAIGDLARDAMRQPDVAYVLVYDAQGRIVPDGSGDIPAFGQPMNDPFAFEVVAARNTHTQSSDRIVDIASPIMIGDQRLGGVRVGFSLASMQKDEDSATKAMQQRLEAIGRKHLGWIAHIRARHGAEKKAECKIIGSVRNLPVTPGSAYIIPPTFRPTQ